MNVPLVLMNVALAALNGVMAYSNFATRNYGIALFNAWVSGFCAMGATAIFIGGLMK